MTIYAIADDETGDVKIGFSDRSVAGRLSQLKSTTGKKSLTLIGVTEGGRLQEEAIHKRFAVLNVAGEWFRRSAELDAWLKQLHPQAPILMSAAVSLSTCCRQTCKP